MASTKVAGTKPAARALRRLDERFEDRRFEPAGSARAYLGALLLSLGALGLGAGAYALFALGDRPTGDYGLPLLGAGAVLLVAYLLVGGRRAPVLRVGDLGVGIEEEGRVARKAWWEIKALRLNDGRLELDAIPRPVVVDTAVHREAAARIVAEARDRIPKRVEIDEQAIDELGAPGAGAKVQAEPPQVTQATCHASDKPLTFERDVRMCGRCGALYHRTAVPRRCVECDKKLKRAG